MIKLFGEKLTEFDDHPQALLTSDQDIFGKPLQEDQLLFDLKRTPFEGHFKDALKLCVRAIRVVTERQLGEYINGDLSAATPDVLEATKSATPHNVWAERVLGMCSAIHDRTNQASSVYIETKIQCATNKTLEWLNSKDIEEQSKLVTFAVKMARILRQQEKDRKRWLRVEAERRLVEVAEKKDEKTRRAFEGQIATAAKTGGVDGFLSMDRFSNLAEDQVEKVRDILAKKSMRGVRFSHDYDENGATETWQAEIIGQTRRKSGLLTYRVKYWIDGFQEEMDEDPDVYNLFAEKILCDLFMGDLKFL